MPRALLLAIVLLGLVPAAAPAAVRYVKVGGETNGSAACDAAAPCEISNAFAIAQAIGSTDEVVIAAGDYPLTSTIQIHEALTVHGAAGARPRLLGTTGVAFEIGPEPVAAVVRDLEVQQSSADGTAIRAAGATLERVVAVATGTAATALDLRAGSAARSSVARAPGSGGAAVLVSSSPAAGGVQLQHVTAVGADAGLRVNGIPADAAVTAVNSILRGGVWDIRVDVQPPSVVAVTVDHVAYRLGNVSDTTGWTFSDQGGTVAADPLFADDLHQAAGSATIDAGRIVAGGPAADIDGEARSLGAAPDLGADERQPPPPVEPSPTPSATPEATPAPTPPSNPLAPPDFTLPGILEAGFPSPPVAGKPSTLVVRAYDPDSPILGIVVDLGPAGLFAESACRNFDATGIFAPGQVIRFRVPVVFAAPGLQAYAVEIRSGGCGGVAQSSRTEYTTRVKSGVLTARAAAVLACAGNTLLPTAGTERRLAAAVVCLVNKERKAKRLKPLKVNRRLVTSASAQTADMVQNAYYGHQRPGGPDLFTRTRRAKYRGDVGENLGLGNGVLAQPAEMLKAWMNSPPHRANILGPRYRTIGVSVQTKDPLKRMTGAAIYTINFGTKK